MLDLWKSRCDKGSHRNETVVLNKRAQRFCNLSSNAGVACVELVVPIVATETFYPSYGLKESRRPPKAGYHVCSNRTTRTIGHLVKM